MIDYIERDKMLAKFIEGDGDDEFTEGYNFAVNEYREKIQAMPAADVQPVKHGHWKKRMSTPDSIKCSVCGNNHGYDTRYCPHCGAKMTNE